MTADTLGECFRSPVQWEAKYRMRKMPAAGRPRLSHARPRAATCPHHIFRCNKSLTYFGNPLLRESVSFFVPLKMFHLVYSQCFTMYRSNVAVN